MKLQLGRAEFADAITWATRLVGPRPHLPVLSGVLIEAAEGRLTCRAHDLEVAGQISVAANVEEPGRALLPGKLLASLAAKLPDAPVVLSTDGDDVLLKCGRSNFSLRGMPVDDYPNPLAPVDDAPSGVLKADGFARLVSQVARAAGSDEGRPMLTGVKVEATADAITAAATDSYRLSVRTLEWEEGVEAEALIPARALQEAAKAAADAGGEVRIAFEEGQVSFLLGDRRLTTRLVDAMFPNYRSLLPAAFETTVTVQRAALIEALQRVALVAIGQTNSPVTLSFGDGTVTLKAGGQEGAAEEALPAEIDGEGLDIAFNPVYLLAGLEATGTENIRIDLQNNLKPAVLRPQPIEVEGEDGPPVEDFLYLLMPMRVN